MKAQKEIMMKLNQYKLNIIPISYTLLVFLLLIAPIQTLQNSSQAMLKIAIEVSHTLIQHDKITHIAIY
jgi:hypothetical protein